MRQSRKLDHVHISQSLSDGPVGTGFSQLKLIHNCLPNLCWKDIKLETKVVGISLPHPIMINAITGGVNDVIQVNADLAELARRTGAAMAVGSQYSALEDSAVRESYTVIRKINPEGICFANLGAHATPAEAKAAVEMIEADALQLHLNVAQELFMAEGDRNFWGYSDNIAAIVNASQVPVIVKEVGFGIAREQAQSLFTTGIKAIDIGGAGGTNFIAIEATRSQVELNDELLKWGIPTAVSAVEVASVLPQDVDLIVSGGIRTPLDVVKALALGAQAVGIAAPVLKVINEQGLAAAECWLNHLLEDTKRLMLLVGAKQVADLKGVPLVIIGETASWLTARGIDILEYAKR